MIFTYKNFIIWLECDGIRAISEDKNIRLKLELNPDKNIQNQVGDMIKWIDKLEKIKNKLVIAKRNGA